MTICQELDMRVAKALYKRTIVTPRMKWACDSKWGFKGDDGRVFCPDCQLPMYSESLEGSFKVVDAMHQRGWLLECGHQCRRIDGTYHWYAMFLPEGRDGENAWATAPNLSLAICYAALSALGAWDAENCEVSE